MPKLLLLSCALAIVLNSTAMERDDVKRVRFDPTVKTEVKEEVKEEKQAPEEPLEVEVRIVLTPEQIERIRCFGNVPCANIPLLMRHITVLSLEGSNLDALPRGFDELKALRKLCLAHNNIPGLFPERWSFPALEELDISNTKAGTRNIVWTGMNMLRKLKAQRAGFRMLCDTIANLHRLESVDFSHNELTSINSMIFLHATIILFNFAHNRIKKLSAEVSNFRNLEELYMDGNQLTEIPQQIGGMKTVRVISLSKNQLGALPESCAALPALRLLNVFNNNLTAWPPFIAALKELEQLLLHGNQLTEFPLELVARLALKKLTISENPIADIEVLKQVLSKHIGVVV